MNARIADRTPFSVCGATAEAVPTSITTAISSGMTNTRVWCTFVAMMPPTSARLVEADTVPYFLWDLGVTVGEMRRVLASDDSDARDELIVRLLREANTRDVWLFLDWASIEEAWERVVRRLGRLRPVWEMLLEFHRAQRAGTR